MLLLSDHCCHSKVLSEYPSILRKISVKSKEFIGGVSSVMNRAFPPRSSSFDIEDRAQRKAQATFPA